MTTYDTLDIQPNHQHGPRDPVCISPFLSVGWTVIHRQAPKPAREPGDHQQGTGEIRNLDILISAQLLVRTPPCESVVTRHVLNSFLCMVEIVG